MNIDLDIFIQITFVLLVLSLINEKLVNFVKLRWPDNALKRLLNPKVHLSRHATVADFVEADAKKKGREIQTLAMFMGISLAIACRANLFKIYEEDYELGWGQVVENGYSWLAAGSDFIGCILTGIFLSLGSKFFHDLLDLLLETKNLKKKLTDRGSIDNLHTIEEFDKYIAEVEPIVIEKGLNEAFKDNPNIQRYEYSEVDDAVDVYLQNTEAEEAEKMSQFINIDLANKTTKAIEINYIII